MTALIEGDLRIAVPAPAVARRFDGKGHGLSHCMKAVDFVVEQDDSYLFIEIKDPARGPHPEVSAERFSQRFVSGQIDADLTYKFRDSFLYEWAAGRADKPVDYLVLIALGTLETAELLARRDALETKIPIGFPDSSPWKRSIARLCGVFNIASWNRAYPQYRVDRLSEAPPESG